MPTLHEGATTLSDYEFITRNDGFWWTPEIDFPHQTEARKHMVDFKFHYTGKSS